MTLTNYWWLLIWLFTGGLVLDYLVPKQEEIVCEKKERRWTIWAAILMIIPYIIWAGFRTDSFGDTIAYRKNFLDAPQINQLSLYLANFSKDKGFHILTVVLKTIIGNSDKIYLCVIAAAQLLVIALVCRRLSANYWLSIFVFVASSDYMSWVHNGVRQFTAVAVIFAATEMIVKKKYMISILLILLATTLHGSAIIMLPIIFLIQGKALNKKSVLCIIVSILVLIFVDQFTNILDVLLNDTQYENVVSDWKSWNDNGTNPIRVLIYAMPTILSVIGYKYIKEADDLVINLGVNAGLIATALGIISIGTSGIFLGRLPIYVSLWSTLIVLPWEIENMFSRRSISIIKIVLIVCYLMFFYYQMHFTWNIM